ncbi:MAG: hypothetical protein RI959_1027 [Pseudomonadota bacterium]
MFLLTAFSGVAQAQLVPTEGAFFDDLPVVLTVSRLAQPLSDTPGAVTVLDRDAIRRSGARTLADLLRLVPGYVVSGYNGANPAAFYHAPLDEFGGRNLVQVDGRSLYTATFLGGTHRGMLTVQLDDIERIEVLRGSNSAAYGANALFGVINVVTRHSADTLGGFARVDAGEADIRDVAVRVGWGASDFTQRLTVAQRSDSGYKFVNDDSRTTHLQWRGDLKPNAQDELQLQAGYTDGVLADGVEGSRNNAPRDTIWKGSYLRGVWTRQSSAVEQSRWSLNWDEERVDDALLGIALHLHERRLQMEYQHQNALDDATRLVWGVGYKHGSAVAPLLFGSNERISSGDVRAFGNLEWKLDKSWLLNTGLFAGNNNITGAYAAPRLMMNYQMAPGHTLRFGVSHAQREPALFQLYGDVKYYIGGTLARWFFKPNTSLQPEQLRTKEITYLGHLPASNLTLDARLYEEKLSDQLIGRNNGAGQPLDYFNAAGGTFQGLDGQLKWSPNPETQWVVGHNINQMKFDPLAASNKVAPVHVTSLMWFQRLPAGWDMSWMLHHRSAMVWRERGGLDSANRLDVRLAKQFRWGASQAEAALTVLAANGDQKEFTTEVPSLFTRRAFVTLKLGF